MEIVLWVVVGSVLLAAALVGLVSFINLMLGE